MLLVDVSSLGLFISTSLILAITPGPDNMFVLNQSVNYGLRAGLIITLGLCTGLLVHSSLVALGLATIIQQSPSLFISIQLLGVLYLLYLAKRIFFASPLNPTARVYTRKSEVKLYIRGLVMNVSNPKVTLFFLAFLPQFIDPTASVISQISLLGFIFILITLLVFGSVAFLADRLQLSLNQSSLWQHRINKLTALVFVAFSVSILFNLFI